MMVDSGCDRLSIGSMHTSSTRLGPLLLLAMLLTGCGNETGPWLAFDGGGFVFNYRVAQASYGFNVKPLRRLTEGTVLEAEFEDPAGGKPLVFREEVKGPKLRYSFETLGLSGVKAHTPYKATIRVLEPGTLKVLASYDKIFKSSVDGTWLPDKPLVVGPVYTPNPDLKAN